MNKFSFSQFWGSEIKTRSEYFVSWLLSIIITSVTTFYFLQGTSNVVNVIMGITLIPLLIQVLVASVMTKRLGYVYQFEAAVTIMLPFAMNSLGTLLGFWMAYEIFGKCFEIWTIALSILALLIIPLFANFFASGNFRRLDLKPRIFYLLNLVQISLGALIMMLIFNYIFKH